MRNTINFDSIFDNQFCYTKALQLSIQMQTYTTIARNKAAQSLSKKRSKKDAAKAKVRKFAKAFYAQYGQMMSKLSHE